MADSGLQMVDQQERDSHAVDIDALARELTADDASADQLTGGDGAAPFIIAEVPTETRNVDNAAYDPHRVSIGPYHRAKNLAMDDDEKKRCLGDVMSVAKPGATVAECLRALVPHEDRARGYYANMLADLTSKELLRMLLLDACYVLVWLGAVDGYANGRRRSDTATANGQATLPSLPETAGGNKHDAIAVLRDVLYLAENQIPFFVIDKIYRQIILDSDVSVSDKIAGYVQTNILQRQQYSMVKPAAAELSEAANLLHLLHIHFKPTAPSSTATGGECTGEPVGRWRRATEYSLVAGVKFKVRHVGAECILDVKHSGGGGGGGTVQIPRLNIDNETWRILRNLIALEQSNPSKGSHVTAYCVFMSQLACTTEDVELLSKRRVIAHGLGNHEEVAAGFADLCKGVVFRVDNADGNYLWPTCQALERCFRSRTRRWMALLRRRYFGNPWLTVGLAAGAVGLACAVVQAVYSVLASKH